MSSVSADVDRLLFESPLIRVGQFRLPVGHPQFGDTGPTDGYCFVFPRSACWIEHEGSTPFVADANVVPLYNEGHPYRRRQIRPEGDRTDWFSIAPSLLRDMLSSRDPVAAEAPLRLFRHDFARAAPQTYLAQRRILLHVTGAHPPDALYVEESAIDVLDDVLRQLYGGVREPDNPRAHRELAESTRAHLNVRFAEQEGLTALARSVGASIFHLCRVFRRCSGLTIHRYRSELRLRQSLELVAEANADILTTAIELGYSGHSHFTHAFHRAFGVTPSRFRELSRRSRAERSRIGTRRCRRVRGS